MFKLEIETDNAAFGETENERIYETARILSELVQALDRGGLGASRGNVLDINGNTVGRWEFTP